MTASNTHSKLPKPPRQRISNSRVSLIKFIAIVAAVALTIFDAKVSYDGFKMMVLPKYVPLVLALLIFVVQLASGAVQQLGMNPFHGVGGSDFMDFIWRWVLVSIYVIDVGSNAIAFGINNYLGWQAFLDDPIDSLVTPIILLVLALLLTFGDEILLRLVDRLELGGRSNALAAQKGMIDQQAYQRYLAGYKERAIHQGETAGQSATVEFDWMKHQD